jgi:serine/threonine protein kinase
VSGIIDNRVKNIDDAFEKGVKLGEGSFGTVFQCKKKGMFGGPSYALKELSKAEH